MSVEENIALMKRWFQEVWNEGRLETIFELVAPGAVAIGQGKPGEELRGPGEFAAFYNRIHGAFPDMKITIDDAFGADNKVVVRWSSTMTHTGNDLGIPATKKKIRVTGISITYIENGKVVRGWDNWDQLAMMEQLSSAAASA
jgi:steroid delta-isomerase-like uncharacterized protein